MIRRRSVLALALVLVVAMFAGWLWLEPADPAVAISALEDLDLPQGWAGEDVAPPYSDGPLREIDQLALSSPHLRDAEWQFSREWRHGDRRARASVIGHANQVAAAISLWDWHRTWGDVRYIDLADESSFLCPESTQCRALCDLMSPHCTVQWRVGATVIVFSSEMFTDEMPEADVHRIIEELHRALAD